MLDAGWTKKYCFRKPHKRVIQLIMPRGNVHDTFLSSIQHPVSRNQYLETSILRF
jgi:hypothetical protein